MGLTLMQRVKRGAAVLDAEIPGWQERIDTEILDLEDRYTCTLGQLFDEYYHGITHLHPARKTQATWARSHGFNVKDGTPQRFMNLTQAWKEYFERYFDAPTPS